MEGAVGKTEVFYNAFSFQFIWLSLLIIKMEEKGVFKLMSWFLTQMCWLKKWDWPLLCQRRWLHSPGRAAHKNKKSFIDPTVGNLTVTAAQQRPRQYFWVIFVKWQHIIHRYRRAHRCKKSKKWLTECLTVRDKRSKQWYHFAALAW